MVKVSLPGEPRCTVRSTLMVKLPEPKLKSVASSSPGSTLRMRRTSAPRLIRVSLPLWLMNGCSAAKFARPKPWMSTTSVPPPPWRAKPVTTSCPVAGVEDEDGAGVPGPRRLELVVAEAAVEGVVVAGGADEIVAGAAEEPVAVAADADEVAAVAAIEQAEAAEAHDREQRIAAGAARKNWRRRRCWRANRCRRRRTACCWCRSIRASRCRCRRERRCPSSPPLARTARRCRCRRPERCRMPSVS